MSLQADLLTVLEPLFQERLVAIGHHVEEHRAAGFAALGLDYFSGWRLPLLPFYLDHTHYARIEQDLRTVVGILQRSTELFFGGDVDRHLAYLALEQDLAAGVRRFWPLSQSSRIARPDLIIVGDSAKVLEANIDTGIGMMGSCHFRLDLYQRNRVLAMGLASAGVSTDYPDPLPAFAAYLHQASAGAVWLLRSDRDWLNQYVEGYLGIQLHYLERHCPGLRILQPAGLAEVLGEPTSAGSPAYVYRNVSPYQFLRRPELEMLAAAALADRVRMDCSPASLLFESKVNFCLLSDPAASPAITASERATLDRCIPWTRRLDHAVVQQLTDHRKFVLKKGNSHGGRDVLVGRDSTRADFDAMVARGLTEGNWIVQEFIEAPRYPNLFLMDGALTRWNVPFTAHAFLIDGRLSGMECITAARAENSPFEINAPGIGEMGAGAVSTVR